MFYLCVARKNVSRVKELKRESAREKRRTMCVRVSLSLFYKLRFVSLSLYFYLFLSSTYLSKS